ncbi:MAG: ArsR family transcriptional regulator [Thermoplasmata archaeon]|nr:ArsR family transcriptional regulator [Thermoplasmata archaeon]
MSEETNEFAPGYSSAKREILHLLKRRPGASLAEVATELQVSKAAILGHLAPLEAEGLVERAYRAGQVGRPRVVFRLTDRAADLFPQGYTEMSLCALDFIERRMGRTGVVQLLQERAHEMEDRHRDRLALPQLRDRVGELARIRTEGGYMAETGARNRGSFEILEHNCPILALAGRFPEACETERRMFEVLLRARVDVNHRLAAGDSVCRFRVRPAGPKA